jgi:tetratricopeptide (TPR) repeat protein
MKPNKLPAVALVIAVVASAPAARAQNDKVAAEALFEEGRRLVAQRNPAQACPKFVESQRLDPSAATLLNLASCYERLGKTASAWATYREAASTAAALNRPLLVPVAQRHAATLEPTLARLVITVAVPVDGLEVRREGSLVRAGEWDVAVPVDPGALRIEATAPRKKKWSSTVEISEPGKTVALTVPALEDGPPEPVAVPIPNAGAAAGSGAGEAPPPGAPPMPPLPPSRGSPQKAIGVATGLVGIAGLAVGTVLLATAKARYNDSLAGCPVDANRCTAAAVSVRNDARRAGNEATVAYGVGGAALVTGVVLFLTSPKAESGMPTTGLRVAPTFGGLAMDGRW